jgi:hypothetical protein
MIALGTSIASLLPGMKRGSALPTTGVKRNFWKAILASRFSGGTDPAVSGGVEDVRHHPSFV